jgi:hypothetical protein
VHVLSTGGRYATCWRSVCCLTALLVFGMMLSACTPTAPLAIRIVTTSTQEKGEYAIILSQPAPHIQVRITNTSDQAIRVWREWCSWGEQTLSFRITDEHGHVVTVTRVPRSYDKNVPDWDNVPPGDHRVFEVSFDPAAWTNVPLPAPGQSRIVKMQAIFTIPEDVETKAHSVWTGRVLSSEYIYTMHR